MTQRLSCLVLALLFSFACGSSSETQPPSSGAGAATGRPPASSALTGSPPSPQTPGERSAAVQPPPSAAPAVPLVREVTIPAGTALRLVLQNAVASDTSKPEDPVRARLSRAIVIDGETVIPEGAQVTGTVLSAQQSGKVKGRASLSFRFNRVLLGDDAHEITTARISRQAAATKGEDAKKIGIGAGAGAAIGAIAGGGKGAAIGSAIGAGAGTGVVVATRGEEVRLGAGAAVRTTLEEPVTILVPAKN